MKYKKGDVLKAKEKIIAHGCNCRGKMGAGVAKQVKKRYPEVFEEYSKITPDNDLIGTIQPVRVEDKIIVNVFTQVYYGSLHKGINYDKFKQAIQKLGKLGKATNEDIAIPRIGAGYGKGKWGVIEKLLKNTEERFEYVVYTL